MNQNEFEEIWYSDVKGIMCHTSGSTGAPKEILLSKEFMKASALRTVDFFGITSDSRLHTCLDFDYIASKMMTVRADVANCLLTSEIPSNRPLMAISFTEKIDLLSVVPSQMDGILRSGNVWNGIRSILIGGAPIPDALRHRISLSGYEVWESYGMTETASHIALRKVTEDPSIPFDTLPGIEVATDERGCLTIDLPDSNTIVTNDIAETISTTQFRILGRLDDCINSGGIKILPQMLETILGGFIASDYAISSIPDTKWGEKLVLVAERSDDGFSDEFMKAAIGVRLNQYRKKLNLGAKSPKDIIFVNSLPRTSNGKINRKELKSILRESYS